MRFLKVEMNRNIFNRIIWIVGIGALITLFVRIFYSFSGKEIHQSIEVVFSGKNVLYILMVLVLMPLNWMIESMKWYKVSKLVEDINFLTALKSLLTGLAFGHLLPGRSSEFLGKILFFSKKNRQNISVLHFVNGAFQLYVTVMMGLFFLVFYFNSNLTEYKNYAVITGMLIFIGLSFLIIYADRLNFLKIFFLNLNYEIPHKIKLELLVWSMGRYMIFVVQFYYMFRMFNSYQTLNLSFISSLAVYFLLTSVIPMISITEVAVRALIAFFVFQSVSVNELKITIITSMIWLINLVIPSLIGFGIWMNLKRKKWKL